MGGDHGVNVTIPAALAFLNDCRDARVLLVGLADPIETELARHKFRSRDRVGLASAVLTRA